MDKRNNGTGLPNPNNTVDDIAADMAMTGEIPLALIREMLRNQEELAARDAAPAQAEIEKAKQEMLDMHAKAQQSQEPIKEEKPRKAKREKQVSKKKCDTLKKSKQREKTYDAQKGLIQREKIREMRVNWAEMAADEFWRDDAPLYQPPLVAFARAFYRQLYFFGLRFARPILAAGRFVRPHLLFMLQALWHMLRTGLLLLHHATIGRAKRARVYARVQRERRLAKYGRSKNPLQRFAAALHDNRRMVRSAVNVAMPLAALLVLLLVIQTIANQTFALSVTFNDIPVGYIANEHVLNQAQAAANAHMQPLALAANGGSNGDALNRAMEAVDENMQVVAQFQVARVQPENLVPVDVLTDRLLESSPNEMISGAGVFIDDELIATVHNVADAESVLGSIIAEQTAMLDLELRAADSVEFIQNIEIVPGFYPANQMIDAQQLLQTLSGVAEDSDHDPLQVKVVRIETRTISVPYGTIDTNNYSIFQGEVRVRVRGTLGQDEVTERVTYVNGVRYGRPEEISRRRLSEPVPQRREIGRRDPRVFVPGRGTVTLSPSAHGLIWPVPGFGNVSSNFGMRWGRMHNGIDIAGPGIRGTGVVAARAGRVVDVQFSGSGWGHMVLIDHGGGMQTRYAHLVAGSIAVSRGQHVDMGQLVGRVGSTGNSTGPHLHFEVLIGGRPQNPLNFVSQRNGAQDPRA
ncbi:MAG: peptidoglycan DD-metalloendopeptidase family protein [Oscillospiraceae bacterium]|nr:peptidoglycan DD-metalloendopeptidase family protein [Oscillospiraceae bacterium]